MPRWAQYLRNVRVATKELTQPVRAAVEQLNGELDGSGRVLVRASGTEPLIRVLAEAENGDVAQKACASLAALVEKELG
jgi:phosphoglucosamine mutase